MRTLTVVDLLTGEPLPDANVYAEGMRYLGPTDSAGMFATAETGPLTVSHVGFERETVPAGTSDARVEMVSETLDEFTVTETRTYAAAGGLALLLLLAYAFGDD